MKVFRRSAVVRSSGDEAVCELEDTYHRFGVTLRQAHGKVAEVTARAARYPWTTCPMAAVALRDMAGAAITTNPAEVYAFADARQHCTHMFETLGMAITQAARGDGERRFDCEVPDPVDGVTTARLWVDGEARLAWDLDHGVITGDSPYAGRKALSLGSHVVRDLPHDEAEAVLILRRAVFLMRGLHIDVDSMADASEVGNVGSCFSYQPSRLTTGKRVVGSHTDFDFSQLKAARS